jgi:hypothetical protein
MVPITRKPALEQVDPPRSPRETLPTMYDLPSENSEEPGLPDEFHNLQPQLLSRTLRLSRYTRENCFTASDLNLYYDVNHPLWYKRPDWFLAVDVPRLYDGKDLRRSNDAKDTQDLVRLYGKLNRTIALCKRVPVVGFDQAAGDRYQQLLIEIPSLSKKRLQKDMRIAAIALSIEAIVATRNYRDFSQVPGLLLEDWTQER